jgi:hypothetical protein
MTQSELELDLGTATMNCTAEEVAATLAGLYREMHAAIPLITPPERAALRQIMAHESGTLTVDEVFPDFERESQTHMMLRRLRTAQFIIPAGPDVWDHGTRIAIKPFARLVWDRLGEAAIFGDEEPVAEPVEEEDIDLALPAVNEVGSSETVRLQDRKAAKWEDDDVLDFLKDDTHG